MSGQVSSTHIVSCTTTACSHGRWCCDRLVGSICNHQESPPPPPFQEKTVCGTKSSSQVDIFDTRQGGSAILVAG